MIAMTRKNIATRDYINISRDELEVEWRKARETFEQALAQKSEFDRIYVAAANQLNILERMLAKLERREADAKRQAARSIVRTA